MIAQPEKQVRNRPSRQSNGRFAPGVSGNPNGRPRAGASLAELIRAELGRPVRGGRRTRKERLAEVIVERALAGDHRFCRMVLERSEPLQGADAGDSMSVEEWIGTVRIGADSPYQPEEARRAAMRLVEAYDAYEAESEAVEEDGSSLSSEPYRRNIKFTARHKLR